MLGKRKLTIVDEMWASIDQNVALTYITKLNDPYAMGVQRAVKDPLSYLVLHVRPDLMNEVCFLGCGKLLVGDGDCAVFVLLLDSSRDVYLPPCLAQRTSILNEHPGRSEGEWVDGAVRHPLRLVGFLVLGLVWQGEGESRGVLVLWVRDGMQGGGKLG